MWRLYNQTDKPSQNLLFSEEGFFWKYKIDNIKGFRIFPFSPYDLGNISSLVKGGQKWLWIINSFLGNELFLDKLIFETYYFMIEQ